MFTIGAARKAMREGDSNREQLVLWPLADSRTGGLLNVVSAI